MYFCDYVYTCMATRGRGTSMCMYIQISSIYHLYIFTHISCGYVYYINIIPISFLEPYIISTTSTHYVLCLSMYDTYHKYMYMHDCPSPIPQVPRFLLNLNVQMIHFSAQGIKISVVEP